MATRNKNNSIMAGAIAAGIAGSLAAAAYLWPKKTKGWSFPTQEKARSILSKLNGLNQFGQSKVNNKLLMGSLAGSVVGATTALLFAPKSGKGLVHDIMKSIHHNGAAKAKIRVTPKAMQVTKKKTVKKSVKKPAKKSTKSHR